MFKKIRRIGYPTLKYLGDLDALCSGKITKRFFRRIIGKFFGKGMGRMFR